MIFLDLGAGIMTYKAPQEIVAIILVEMKKIAQDFIGDKVTDVVLTVPSYFSD